MRKHLALLPKDDIEQIFKGVKTIESRVSRKRVLPFKEVEVADIVYFKHSKSEVLGQFKIKKIIFIEETNLFTTIIYIGSVEQFLTPPINFPKLGKKTWMRVS